MRIPSYQAILGAIIWSVGVLVFGIVALLHSPKLGLVVVINQSALPGKSPRGLAR